MSARHLPCWAAVLALAGCANTGPLGFPPTAAGTPAQSGGAAAGGSVGPSGATLASSQSASVQIGSKAVELSSVEQDTTCASVVAPFDLSDNFSELTKLGLGLAAEGAGSYLSQQAESLAASASGSRAPAAAKVQPLSPAIKRAALRMNWLPMAVEQRYGQYLLEQMRKAGQLMPREGKVGARTYPKGDALLAEVLAGVTEPHAYKFEVFVSTEPGENAMALPGGLIVIDKALLDRPELRDKGYFAVSHEIGHVLQRHQTRALQARVIDAVALKGSLPELIGTMKSASSKPEAVVGLLVGGKLLFEKHSEAQELQADACGMRVLDQGKTNDSRLLAAVQAFARSLPKPEGKVAAPGTAASGLEALTALAEVVRRPVDAHPNTPTRLAHLDTMLVELRKRPDLATKRPSAKPASAPKPKPQPLPTAGGQTRPG